jgi:Methionyl-tRNA formyltransferase
VENDFFSVQTGNGVLKVKEVQLPGKKRMKVNVFLRGNVLETGTLLKRVEGTTK